MFLRALAASAAFLCSFQFLFSADQYFSGTGGGLNGSNWGSSASGPFTSGFTSGNRAIFAVPNGTGAGQTICFGAILATENFTLTSANGTITNLGGGVIPVEVAAGKTLDFALQAFTTGQNAGYIKNGEGTWAFKGGTYSGGFTLNAGTVVMRGDYALGFNYDPNISQVIINGGVLASNTSRNLTSRYPGGITVGGDFQFGSMIAPASPTAGLTLTSKFLLGNAPRTITLGNNGIYSLSGSFTSSGNSGLTFAAAPGVTGWFEVTGTNSFTGPVKLNGGEVRFGSDAAFGAAGNSITIDGGRLTTVSKSVWSIDASRPVYLGDSAGTAIDTLGSASTLTYNGGLSDKPGSIGMLVKRGAGTLVLGGTSNYSGQTCIQSGTVRLTIPQALPAGTTIAFGTSGASGLGSLDLNGADLEIAALTSIPGNNATAGRNKVSSSSPATLIVSGSGTSSFGAGTPGNSGVIGGSIRLFKDGCGTLILGDLNTYTGETVVRSGKLGLTGFGTLGSGDLTFSGGTLDISGISTSTYSFAQDQRVSGTGTLDATGKTVSISGTLNPGTGGGTLMCLGNLTLTNSAVLEMTIGGGIGSTCLAGIENLTLGGTIRVDLDEGFTPSQGERFGLLSWSGALDSTGFNPDSDLLLPDLPGSLQWETAEFLTNGSILVIPEPATVGILLLGAGLIGVRHLHGRLRS